ncbi:MAG: RagB/SusD family nutrient uptake outer membrane protein, partial [Tannerella sp.]|nr:RagB/SusD family nutrient uptake outer membrane protein [Tannerella sp.]
ESFLTRDGKPYSTVAGYDKKSFAEVFVDRDPRFAETFAYPGINNDVNGAKTYHIPNPQRGGYSVGKYFMRVHDREHFAGASLGQYNGLSLYRYAEVLLNYAEAKAELGQLTDEVVSKTINRLRDRVSMPHFNPSREVDATLRSLYPNVADEKLLALRRERRVELASEGFRQADINRWYAGKVYELNISKQGIYVPSSPYVYTVPGFTNIGIGIAATQSAATNAQVKWYYIDKEPGTYLENGTSGFVRNTDDQNRHFDEPKDYYRPIPLLQTVLNPNLTQPYGW